MNEKKPQTIQTFIGDNECKKTHLQLFEQLSKQPDNITPVSKALLILSTPRCGSTMFCEALNSCGKLGLAEEWLNYEYFAAWMSITGRDSFNLIDYTNWVFNKSCRDTGTWVLKWHIGQLVAMNEDFNFNISAMDFYHVVYLYRRDKIAQAVSLVKAATSNCYRSTEKAADKVKMSRQGIVSALENITKFDTFAQTYLSKYVNASYAYEDFRHLDHEAYNNTLEAMGKSPSQFSVKKIKPQSNAQNVKAITDFRNYILGEN